MEVRFGLALMRPGRQRTRLEGRLASILEQILEGRILAFDASAALATATLMAERQSKGRRGDLRDSMIAGIAIAEHAMLATRNIRHFDDLRVPVVNPWAA